MVTKITEELTSECEAQPDLRAGRIPLVQRIRTELRDEGPIIRLDLTFFRLYLDFAAKITEHLRCE